MCNHNYLRKMVKGIFKTKPAGKKILEKIIRERYYEIASTEIFSERIAGRSLLNSVFDDCENPEFKLVGVKVYPSSRFVKFDILFRAITENIFYEFKISHIDYVDLLDVSRRPSLLKNNLKDAGKYYIKCPVAFRDDRSVTKLKDDIINLYLFVNRRLKPNNGSNYDWSFSANPDVEFYLNL